MVQKKQKSLQYKVIIGYLLLFSFAVLAVWFVYTEISKAANPGISNDDNQRIIRISNTIANLYTSEALGRSAILTGNPKDYNRYAQYIDSINNEIELIKKDAYTNQAQKFDSIQLLIQRKKKSVTDIVQYRKTYSQENVFANALNSVYLVKDSVKSNTKPVKFEKSHQWSKLVNEFLTPKLLDSLSKLDVSNDSIFMAFDKALSTMLVKDNKIKYRLYRKEQLLLEENRIISDQLRAILSSVENEILKNSYTKINSSQLTMSETINKMAWIGGVALLVLIIFAWIIINDITTSQNYRMQLESLNIENQELLRSKTMLMATVTHDLQTPLGSIIGFSDLMDNSGMTGKQKQYLSNIRESADYILKLVNDLMDFSKLENKRISIEEVNFNIKNVIENTCKTLEHTAENKNIELYCDINEELDNNFISDPYRIKQVLTNLISNAIKFTHQGSVKVTAFVKDNYIYISVSDTGIGIEKDSQENIFKEFTQANSGIEKKFGGTGLGLTISKKILELLGGTIELESEEGKGSVFTIMIPCIPGEYIINKENIPQQSSYPFLKGKKVLLVDDDNTQLSLLKEILSAHNVNVRAEINSSAVLPLLKKEDFDLVLTDIQMPIMDGFELLKNIKSSFPAMPVIALSGRKDLSIDDFTSKGFTAYHPKPIHTEKLLILISNVFGDQRSFSEAEKIKESTKSGMYNLESLSQFTQNDPKSLRMIIQTFIDSAIDNCNTLNTAALNHDEQSIIETAHKMIPMLKQLEAHHIVNILDSLEDGKHSGNWKEINNQITSASSQINLLIEKLKTEIN